MLWQEDDGKNTFVMPDDIVDLSFQIECKQIALDHAHDLSQALQSHLPWLTAEKDAGVHMIHGASTGNGWVRPEDDFIYLSRRSRMQLRVPRERIHDAATLVGKTLDVGGYTLRVGDYQVKSLMTLGTLFARHVLLEDGEDEERFLQRIVSEMKGMGLRVKKVLCGIGHTFKSPEGDLVTLSVMVADLDPESSYILQRRGLGRGRHMGFGLFIPHKSIKPVGDVSDKTHFSGT